MRRFFAFRWLSLGGLLLFLAACGKGAGPAATPLDTPFALTQTAYVAAIRATQTARHGATRTAIMQMMLTGTPTPTAPAPTRTPFPIPSTAPLAAREWGLGPWGWARAAPWRPSCARRSSSCR